MAVIYDFNEYRSLRLLRTFSRQTGAAVHGLNDLGGKLGAINAHVDAIEQTMRPICSQLDGYLLQLEKIRGFTRRCAAACALTSIDQMVEQRDQLIQERLQMTRL